MDSQQPMKPSKHVTEARAAAQRAKLDAQAETRRLAAQQTPKQKHARRKREPSDPLAKRRAATTLVRAIEDYLNDHEGGNHSLKTLQWHQTSLGLLRRFLQEEREITLVGEVDAPDISAWFAHLRKTPGSHGKPRTERTVQTYARSCAGYLGYPFEKSRDYARKIPLSHCHNEEIDAPARNIENRQANVQRIFMQMPRQPSRGLRRSPRFMERKQDSNATTLIRPTPLRHVCFTYPL
jgi:hypothetical protein